MESNQTKFDIKNQEEIPLMHLLYEDEIENEPNRNIHDIKKQNNDIQIDINFEQIKIEYLLCNTSTKTYVTEIRTNLKIMERQNIKNKDTNFIIEPQKLIKQRNQELKHAQIPNIDTTTPKYYVHISIKIEQK